MKKVIAFLLAFMMLVGVLFIFVSAEETTDLSTDCTCGGSYGDWTLFATEICQIRYSRSCGSCGNSQVAKDIVATTVSYNTPAIGANTGDTVFLSLYSVYFDSETLVSADKITWSTKEDGVSIEKGQVTINTTGTYELVATSGTSTKSVYLIVKNPTDSEYVLFYDDFNREALGNDYRPIEIPNKTEYYLKDGNLVMDAFVSGNKDAQMRILLPEWIDVFSDYKIDTVFTMNQTINNDKSYWFAVMARVDNGGYPFWQAAVRKGAKSHSSGVELAYKRSSTEKWNVPYKSTYLEDLNSTTPYKLTFDIVGNKASHTIANTKNSELTKVVFSSKNAAYLQNPTTLESVITGGVGFHLRAAKVSIDSVKIFVPVEDKIEHATISHAAKASTCTEHGWAAYKTCSNCDYTTYAGDIPALGHYFDREFHSIAHRGYSTVAPENTLPAYRLAAEMGFYYAECDIAFTKDGVAVLLHDDTIDRTSNGSGKISELTYAEIKDLDFGSWKSEDYAGTKIPTFEEFIALCKEIGLHPYIELKETGTFTQAQINSMVAILTEYDMLDNCSWISFKADNLKLVRNADSTARLGYLSSGFTSTTVNTAKSLRNGENEVFLDISYSVLNSNFYDKIALAAKEGLAIEAWTVDTTNNLLKLPMYVSGIASNVLYAEDYLLSSVVTNPTCGEQGYTTYTCLCGATKVADYVDATEEHTAKDGVCTECGADVYCANKEHNLKIISIAYANGLDKEGVKVVKCLDCDALATEAVANPVFICLGYSVPENDRAGVAVTFSVDTIALNEYENATGNTVRYGAFAVSQNNIRDNEIFDANGNLQGGVICADVTEYEFNSFDIVITGFNEDQKDFLFAMGAFIAVTNENSTEYSYIQNEAPEANAVYSFESYNSILSKMEGVE